MFFNKDTLHSQRAEEVICVLTFTLVRGSTSAAGPNRQIFVADVDRRITGFRLDSTHKKSCSSKYQLIVAGLPIDFGSGVVVASCYQGCQSRPLLKFPAPDKFRLRLRLLLLPLPLPLPLPLDSHSHSHSQIIVIVVVIVTVPLRVSKK